MLEQLQNIDTWLTLAVNGSHSLWLDAFALSITSTMTWIAAAAMLLYVVIRSGEMKDILIIIAALALCILLADQIASGIFKPLVARFRPLWLSLVRRRRMCRCESDGSAGWHWWQPMQRRQWRTA